MFTRFVKTLHSLELFQFLSLFIRNFKLVLMVTSVQSVSLMMPEPQDKKTAKREQHRASLNLKVNCVRTAKVDCEKSVI